MAQFSAESQKHSLFELTDKDLANQNDAALSAAVFTEIVGDVLQARKSFRLVKSTEDLLFWDGSEEHKNVATDKYGLNEHTVSGYIDFKSGKDAGKHVTFDNGAALDAAQRELGGDLDQKLALRTTSTEYEHGYTTVQQCTASGLCSQDESVEKGNMKATVHFGLEGQFQSAEATIHNADGSSERFVFNVEQNISLVDIVHPDKTEDIRHFDYRGRLQSAEHIAIGVTAHQSYDVEIGKLKQ